MDTAWPITATGRTVGLSEMFPISVLPLAALFVGQVFATKSRQQEDLQYIDDYKDF